MSQKIRYAIVGTGSRAMMYRDALFKDYAASSELAAVCDTNPKRMAAWLEPIGGGVPTYLAADFAEMLREQRIDRVIVTSVDATHHQYVCAAMELGCDVISEKPLTTDAEKCQQILDTVERTGRNLRVTFNYRYAPRNAKVKELLDSGAIGDPLSVHFEWLLDTQHGADYFRRWHREKANSGGLMVHKATHHFDLVNWWLDSVPETVFAQGGLRFYGRENAERRGEPRRYLRGTGDLEAASDPFALDLSKNADLKRLYLDCEDADGYLRDRNVFGDGIDIEDDLGVMVRYRSGAVMTYHLTAYSPWEGYRVAFNGTRGRLELDVVEKAYVSGGDADHNLAKNVKGAAAEPVFEPVTLTLRPHWKPPEAVDIPQSNEGGHGGADTRMLADLFASQPAADPLGRAATHIEGALSILTGIAANRSLATGMPIETREVLPELDRLLAAKH